MNQYTLPAIELITDDESDDCDDPFSLALLNQVPQTTSALKEKHENENNPRVCTTLQISSSPKETQENKENLTVCPNCHHYCNERWLVDHLKLCKAAKSTRRPTFGTGEHSPSMSGSLKYKCPLKYTCPKCNKEVNSQHNLNQHMTKCFQPDRFKCNICSKAYKSSKRYRQHIKICSPQPTITCSTCKKVFQNKQLIDKHSCPRFNCRFYPKIFTSKRALTKHEFTCEVNIYKCQNCKMEFHQIAAFRILNAV